MRKFFPASLLLLLLSGSCVTYYSTQYAFNKNFEVGKLDAAEKVLLKDKKGPERKTRLLHFLNLGTISFLQGHYAESNRFFEEAYIIGEDYQKNYFNEAVALFANPFLVEYKGEDHEHLLLHYYKALNFLKLNNYEAALVEARRMNIRLNQLNDKYSSENKYKRDAFIHLLMGLVYDANREYNNAFIAYRNAYNIYKEDYPRLFGLQVPEQLKQDLMRTAYLIHFDEDLRRYEEEFGIKYLHDPKPHGEMVFFWNSGLGPVKTEWAINFVIIKGDHNDLFFKNTELNMNFHFKFEEDEKEKRNSVADLELLRIVLPKYVERPLLFREAYIELNHIKYPLQKAEDVNAIAFHSLEQRIWLELSRSLLRVALKKATEHSIKRKNSDLGTAIGIMNFISERADVRNWQSIPHSIYYTRTPLNEGENTFTLHMNPSGAKSAENHSFTILAAPGKTIFGSFHSLETGSTFARY